MAQEVGGLLGCDQALCEAYDLALMDLDGVVYVGREPVPGVREHLEAAQRRGLRLAYVTNNASRPPAQVAEHLRELGVPAESEDVVTSAQAAARLVSERVPNDAAVFVIGGEGLVEALAEHGLRGVQELEPRPDAVVSGYHPDLRWRTVIDGAILVRRGVPWVASNTDLTVPTPHGPGPGNGVLVGAVARYAGVEPQVAGKPEPTLFEETVRRLGGRRPLVVGDRLDTDIAGAHRAGHDSLLVLTGVTDLDDLVAAEPALRPTYLAATLATLTEPQPAPTHRDGAWQVGGWSARTDSSGTVEVTGHGARDDWWRAVASCAWEFHDRTGDRVDVSALQPPRS